MKKLLSAYKRRLNSVENAITEECAKKVLDQSRITRLVDQSTHFRLFIMELETAIHRNELVMKLFFTSIRFYEKQENVKVKSKELPEYFEIFLKKEPLAQP